MPEFNNPVFGKPVLDDLESLASDIEYPSPEYIRVGLVKFWKFLSGRDVLIFIVLSLMIVSFIIWTVFSSEVFWED